MKKLSFITFVLMAGLILAGLAYAASTLASLSLSGAAGSSPSDTVTFTSDVSVPNVALQSTNLVSGSNNLPSGSIEITRISVPSNDSVFKKSDSVFKESSAVYEYKWAVKVNIPSNQPNGTYSGTLKAIDGSATLATSIIVVVVSQGPITGVSFTVSEVNLGS